MIEPGTNGANGTLIGAVQVENASGTTINPATEETVESIAGFNIPKYDYVLLTYTDSTKANLSTAVFKIGGSGGTTVATITVAYPTGTTETYTKS